VLRVYETWREHRYWWDKPWTRDYYRIETESETFFVVFRDDEGRWYLDRRRE
jgi:hypothetical protein